MARTHWTDGRTFLRLSLGVTIAGAALVVGCSSFGETHTVPLQFSDMTSSINANKLKHPLSPGDKSQHLYVLEGSDVAVFALGGTYRIRSITQGINAGRSLSFDSSGNLYVSNIGNNTVTVYAPGKSTVLRTLHDGIYFPFPMTFGLNGNLYVGDLGTNGVPVYGPGKANPVERFTRA